jgi:hypothetical protein
VAPTLAVNGGTAFSDIEYIRQRFSGGNGMESSVYSLTADPQAIRSSAVRWSMFSSSAATSASDIRRIDSGGFRGDEADLYHQILNHDLPLHLDTTADAWTIVSAALTTYATTLACLQSRMSALTAQASGEQVRADQASEAIADASTADGRHTGWVEAARKALTPGESLPPDAYLEQTTGAVSQLSRANAALQAITDAANVVRCEHRAAVDTNRLQLGRTDDFCINGCLCGSAHSASQGCSIESHLRGLTRLAGSGGDGTR